MTKEFGGATLAEAVLECWLMALELLPVLIAYEALSAGAETP